MPCKSCNTNLTPLPPASYPVVKAASAEDGFISVQTLLSSGEEPCAPAVAECAPTLSPACRPTGYSEGKCLDKTWRDRLIAASARFLMWKEDRLAQLEGSGFPYQDENGNVILLDQVPLHVQSLYHRWEYSAGNKPIVGAPLPAPFRVVADPQGGAFLQRGLPTEQSISVWNPTTKTFEETPVSEFPQNVGAPIPGSDNLELVGYRPIPEGGDPNVSRPLRKFEGEGIIIVEKKKTAPNTCDCEECSLTSTDDTYVARVLAPPTSDPAILAFIDGEYLWADPSQMESLRGPAGPKGDQGLQGGKGAQGRKGDRGAACGCGCSCEGDTSLPQNLLG